MIPGRDDQIKARAYEIWEREGRPAGREDEHWQQAVREIGGDASSAFSTRQEQAGGEARTDGRSQMASSFDDDPARGEGSADGALAAAKRPRKPKARKE